jgi:hypothetical protein
MIDQQRGVRDKESWWERREVAKQGSKKSGKDRDAPVSN